MARKALERLAPRSAAPPASNGGGTALADPARVSELFGPLRLTPEQARRFPQIEGSDSEPWDVLLSMLALDEQQALDLLARRTGLRFVAEPKLQESAGRYYEMVPAEIARQHHVAGVEGDGASVTVATAQPFSPA